MFYPSKVKKRSVSIGDVRTSVSLEDDFWARLKAVAQERDEAASDLIAAIDSDRKYGNLSSALRLFVLRDALDRLKKTEREMDDYKCRIDQLERLIEISTAALTVRA